MMTSSSDLHEGSQSHPALLFTQTQHRRGVSAHSIACLPLIKSLLLTVFPSVDNQPRYLKFHPGNYPATHIKFTKTRVPLNKSSLINRLITCNQALFIALLQITTSQRLPKFLKQKKSD